MNHHGLVVNVKYTIWADDFMPILVGTIPWPTALNKLQEKGSPLGSRIVNHWIIMYIQSYLATHQLQNWSDPELIAFWQKNVSAVSACSGLIALARTFMSHTTIPQEKMLHHSVLTGFGTCHVFWNELMMSTEVPLYSFFKKYFF